MPAGESKNTPMARSSSPASASLKRPASMGGTSMRTPGASRVSRSTSCGISWKAA